MPRSVLERAVELPEDSWFIRATDLSASVPDDAVTDGDRRGRVPRRQAGGDARPRDPGHRGRRLLRAVQRDRPADPRHRVLRQARGPASACSRGRQRTATSATCSPAEIGSVSDLLSDPQLSRVCGMVLGVWFPFGRGGVGVQVEAAPSAAPRARCGRLAGGAGRAPRWSRVAARGSGGRAGVGASLRTLAAAGERGGGVPCVAWARGVRGCLRGVGPLLSGPVRKRKGR